MLNLYTVLQKILNLNLLNPLFDTKIFVLCPDFSITSLLIFKCSAGNNFLLYKCWMWLWYNFPAKVHLNVFIGRSHLPESFACTDAKSDWSYKSDWNLLHTCFVKKNIYIIENVIFKPFLIGNGIIKYDILCFLYI